jgi:hypothetical protein
MKTKLLLIISLFSVIAGFSQGTCATAVDITANGTYTTGTINGTYKVACYATFTSPKGNWYKFTPTSNGEVSISSNLPSNDGVTKSDDTRFSIATGLCSGTLTCVSGNDDISASNYLSELLNVPVTAGTTYYIQWDSRWSTLPLDFTFNYTAIACARPTVFYLPEYLSTSSTDLFWDQTTVYPTNYQIDWSNNLNATVGTGTLVTAPSGALAYSTVNLSGLTASSNFRYFVRANCGATQSNWSGPFYGYLPVSLPYTNGFEDASKNYTDGFINFSLITTDGTSTPPNYADGGAGSAMYTSNSTTAASNSRAYFRGMNLTAGEQVTVQFKTRLFAIAPNVAEAISFNLTIGDSQSAAGQATVVQSYTNSSAAAYTTHTATFTAPSSGIFYFGIHNNTPQATTQTFLFLDSISLTTNLSTISNLISNINIYPNPTENFLNISNPNNVEIKSISVVDINGRIVKNQSDSLSQINVSDLNAGVYFVTIEAAEGKTTKKFIKQ